MNAFLPVTYLGSIQYYTKFLTHDTVWIEAQENYNKQTYRNRCDIYSANGRMPLVVPVKKGPTLKIPIREVEIDYDTRWQKIHLKSIESAYKNSPFYDFYLDDFLPVLTKKQKYLWDFNLELMLIIFKQLDIKPQVKFTSIYISNKELKEGHDYREIIHPKKRCQKPDPFFNPVPYTQVFDEKFGFIPNLSIIDVIFNEGPTALEVLKKSIRP